VILASYTALLPIWCFAGKWVGERPLVLRSLDRYGHWLVPTVFIGLGLYILI
jgi:cadmium resistance protein CadD (predicted permease)